MLDHATLLSLVTYDSETGMFCLNKTLPNGRQKGSVIGYFKGRYGKIKLKGKTYAAHRLAWFYVTGEWPSQQIDHINLNKHDNRLANLRLASGHDNNANKTLYATNTSGYKGVTWHKRDKKWQASTERKGKAYHLGYYSTAEEAHKAYKEATMKLCGEFARYE